MSKIYTYSKYARDIETLFTFDSKKIIRRIKNKIVGRLLARAGFWKMLWS